MKPRHHAAHGAGRRRLAALLLSGLMLGMSNLPSVLVQTAGWTWMMVKFSRQGSVQQAVEKTFNGRNPCAMCKLAEVVKTGKNNGDPESMTQPNPPRTFNGLPPATVRFLPSVPPGYVVPSLPFSGRGLFPHRPAERPG